MSKTVEIRSRKNPDVKRTITARAWPNWNQKEWELVQPLTTQEPVKKKDVEGVGIKNPVDDLAERQTLTSNQDDLGTFVTPFSDDIGDEQPVTNAPNYELEDLRAQYEQKFGKPADKRMKVETLKAKINESI